MTDDKEERRLFPSMTEEEWRLLNFVELAILEWESLPLAPKHTDKPPYRMLKDLRCPSCGNTSIQDVACEECDKSVIADLEQIAALELRIEELNADYAKLINHTDPDYVIGLQHRIKELEEFAPPKQLDRTKWLRISTDVRIKQSSEGDSLEVMFGENLSKANIVVVERAKERAKSSSRPKRDIPSSEADK